MYEVPRRLRRHGELHGWKGQSLGASGRLWLILGFTELQGSIRRRVASEHVQWLPSDGALRRFETARGGAQVGDDSGLGVVLVNDMVGFWVCFGCFFL